MARIDKLTKLVAVFDQFHAAIAKLDDATARRLVANWAGVRHHFVPPHPVSRSALAGGLEQGLRETPMLLQSMHAHSKKIAARALADATTAHFPDFFVQDLERLAKIRARGAIRGEREFDLVRHQVDLLEGDPSRADDLRAFYSLIDDFEGRAA